MFNLFKAPTYRISSAVYLSTSKIPSWATPEQLLDATEQLATRLHRRQHSTYRAKWSELVKLREHKLEPTSTIMQQLDTIELLRNCIANLTVECAKLNK